jgi:hypothetical protein
MKSETKLLEAYEAQKAIYEAARSKRIQSRLQMIDDITTKITHLESRRQTLLDQNSKDKEFEDFESFRSRIQKQVEKANQVSKA